MRTRSAVLFGLALASAGLAADPVAGEGVSDVAADAATRVDSRSLASRLAKLTPPDRIEVSIPYPNAGMYLHRGIYGSFAGGEFATQVPDSLTGKIHWEEALYHWQGEIGYFYTEWFSGGVGFRIDAGSPNDDQQTVKNRYYLLARFHKSWPRAAMYLGGRVGTDDVSFALLSDDTTGVGDRLRESNLGVGFSFGYGWKFTRHLGVTFGQRADISLVRQNPSSPHRAVEFLSQPGLALDLVRVFPALGDNVKAFYLLTEAQLGQSLPERGKMTRQAAWIFGTSMAF
jgi:hypothetical protein